jgi:hypothetical protein
VVERSRQRVPGADSADERVLDGVVRQSLISDNRSGRTSPSSPTIAAVARRKRGRSRHRPLRFRRCWRPTPLLIRCREAGTQTLVCASILSLELPAPGRRPTA